METKKFVAGKIKILVIDDEPSVVDAVKLILNDNGYDTIVALTGRDGIEAGKRTRFDVTITDLRLPDMSGIDVLKWMRTNDPSSRVILITSHSTPEVVKKAMNGGAIKVLPKPFSPEELIELVTQALSVP
ncbi:MAG: response regulator [Terriglobia bacterium]|jgi:DNA-binding NtrC family response regulator